MLTEFDQNTMANMTAALEFVCKKIPIDKDSHEVRKHIADAMIERAKSGDRSYVDLQNAGLKMLDELTRPAGLAQSWVRWLSSMPWRATK